MKGDRETPIRPHDLKVIQPVNLSGNDYQLREREGEFYAVVGPSLPLMCSLIEFWYKYLKISLPGTG